jgi:hypothetical protein
MRGTWLVTIVATVGLLLVAALRSVRRRRRYGRSAMEQARRATREIRRDVRGQRGGRKRGDGEHMGRTKINKYGDERHSDPSSGDYSDTGGGYSDSGGGSGGGSD